MANNTFPPESLQQARALVSSLEAGNEADVNQLLDTLGKLRESSLFHELGKLTRELHETINSFHLDARIADLTQKDIPDAKERLNYVITMTEQAANRTLDAVEQSLPLSTQLQERAAGLRAPWQQARATANGALNGVGDQIDRVHRRGRERRRGLAAQSFRCADGAGLPGSHRSDHPPCHYPGA